MLLVHCRPMYRLYVQITNTLHKHPLGIKYIHKLNNVHITNAYHKMLI